jgi:hypothetical protein
MNCDEAFDRMTSPSAPDDAAMRRHLSGCPRCRDMQETLSPAIEWLSAGAEPRSDAPGRPVQRAVFLTEEAVQVAEQAARRLETRDAPAQRRGGSRRNVGTRLVLAGMAALLFFAVAIPSSNPTRSRGPSTGLSSPPSVCLWKMPADDGSRTPPTAEQLIASCTACHLSAQ